MRRSAGRLEMLILQDGLFMIGQRKYLTFEDFIEAYHADLISQTAFIEDMRLYSRQELESYISQITAAQKDMRLHQESLKLNRWKSGVY